MEINSDNNNLKKNEIEGPKIEEIKYNWKNIKSIYNLNEIFSFFNIRRKLKIIIFNKELQKKLGIDIEDYKTISRKYIVGERNGKGKEYDYFDGKLIFEGEYLNGEKNGKGREYNDNDKLKYEGEYLNGERHGKGKEYYDNGSIQFEGEYFDGRRWNGKGYSYKGIKEFEINNGNGYIKEYNYYTKILKFEGEYLNGEKNGKGKEYYFNGSLKFEGEYLNGEKHGEAKEYEFKNGVLIFEGEYLFGGKHGKCKEYDKEGKLIFEGEYFYGKKYELK